MKHTMKVYKGSAEHSAYLNARFDNNKTGNSFFWAGHRWAYEHTSFDDAGDYDLLYRFDDKPYPEEVSVTTDDLTIRDYFAAKAMASIVTGAISVGQGFDSNTESERLSEASYRIADAMLKYREES